MIYLAGLDLGKESDHTALTILEAHGTKRYLLNMADGKALVPVVPKGCEGAVTDVIESRPIVRYNIVHLERLPLKTKYLALPAIVRERLNLTGQAPRTFLALDKTGVGNAVAEMFASFHPWHATITAGNNTHQVSEREWNIPKRELISRVQVALQTGVLKIAPKLEHGPLLRHELENFRYKISAGGHDTYESWRERDHDDMVLATAIACWFADLLIFQTAQARLTELEQEELGRGMEPVDLGAYS